MFKVHTLDINFQNTAEAIASYLIETPAGPVLIESGPASTFPLLESAIRSKGFEVIDIEHLFLTHVHFDHAGAAWKFAQNGTKVYVHSKGLPHLNAPGKLWNSAKQIYREAMETLWGDMRPIPLEQLIPADDGDVFEFGQVSIRTIYTPGHAVHHNAYRIGDIIFTGDVAGVKIGDGPVVPPCPPPDIDIALWRSSIATLRVENAAGLYLTHFGLHENVSALLDELEDALEDWAAFIKPFYDAGTSSELIVPRFAEYVEQKYYKGKLPAGAVPVYEHANPSWMSVNGLLRYWKLKEQGRI